MELKGKKMVIVIAPDKFRDEEYDVPFALLTEQGVKLTTASTQKGVAKGMFNKKVTVELTLDDVNPDDYHGIIFVGGQGTPTVRSHPKSTELAKAFFDKNKVVAAICWAPTILAKAGILQNGRKATVWMGNDPEFNMKTSQVLTDAGGYFVAQKVVIDGNIVTGNGPDAAQKFAEAIIKVLPKY
ncbi:MAG: DJ-1/PfpI family protein [Pseudomonadota bacterium]